MPGSMQLFGGPPRREDEPLTQRHMDLAASIQAVTEQMVLGLAQQSSRETGEKNLVLAGGVALNCVANGKLLRDAGFERIWIQPAAGDAGERSVPRWRSTTCRTAPAIPCKAMRCAGPIWGRSSSQQEVEARLASAGARFQVLGEEEVFAVASADLAAGKALGWFQGRMEFGPRALGGRSILGDPRSASMQSVLNLKVKFRESFRPFAPSVLRESVADWFDLDEDSPYMLLVADVVARRRIPMTSAQSALFGIDKLNVPRSDIPAVTHIDYSARIQTVHADTNPRYHALIRAFAARTGCPVLVNTSFNVRGEPIVCTPEDAFRCFMGTGIESLVVGNCYLEKIGQDPSLQRSYESAFELD
jgi:carbamoyltransferase